jgi:hypothetical protein
VARSTYEARQNKKNYCLPDGSIVTVRLKLVEFGLRFFFFFNFRGRLYGFIFASPHISNFHGPSNRWLTVVTAPHASAVPLPTDPQCQCRYQHGNKRYYQCYHWINASTSTIMLDVKGRIACVVVDSNLLCDCNVLPARETPHVYNSIKAPSFTFVPLVGSSYRSSRSFLLYIKYQSSAALRSAVL